MPNVLILGATGYIGQALALSLLRSGSYTVYGLARTPAAATQLQALEIIPVQGSITDSSAYRSLIREAPIDVVVNAAAGAGLESMTVLNDVIAAGKERLEAATKNRVRVPKLGFLYLSGTWVHGSSEGRVNDLTPVGCDMAPTQPPRLVEWLTVLEREVLAKETTAVLDTVLVRPALVYGRSNTIWTSLLTPLLEARKSGAKTVSLNVDPSSRPALCHVDDVASGLHAAIEKLPLIAGTGVFPVFDLITSQESMVDILTAAGKILGFEGKIDLKGAGEDLFMEAMSVSTNGNSGRAQELLGWKPRRIGYVQQMDIVARAWAASQKA